MLRQCDAEPYLRLRATIESRPTNSNSVYQNGKVLPVYLYALDGKDVFVVEGDDYKFYPAQQVPGSVWLRWETKPEIPPPVVEAPPVTQTPKIAGSNWGEQKADAEKQTRKALAERYAARTAQQGIPNSGDSAFAKASHEFAQVVASSRGQSGPNSKVR